ncbi:uncharacterized protein LOC121923639 [Sceloporus undulatus]|uniref:uncharacterized protein LOC121923639 n=1 Tax=Sceloporus undulatus TaxID=8520 RepID=UPI001C4ACF69|nr:uncharacterized protein LOC121923639 [Sceloporus undulatus]
MPGNSPQPDPSSLNKKVTMTKGSSPKGDGRSLHQMPRAPGTPLHSMCPLCLRTFGNMLYLNPCLHSFCFSCTQSLLETQAECPDCKQPFSSIFHPVKKKECPAEPLSKRNIKDESSSAPSNKKYVREEHMSLSSRKHKESGPFSVFKPHSEDDITLSYEDRTRSRPNLKRPCKHSSFKSPSKDSPLLSGSAKSEARHECYHMQMLGKKPCSDQISFKSMSQESVFTSDPELTKSNFKRPCKPSFFMSTSKTNAPLSGSSEPETLQECHHLHVLGKKSNSDQFSPNSMQDDIAFESIPDLSKFVDDEIDMLRYRALSANLSKPNLLEAILFLLLSGAVVFVCVYIYLQVVVL